MDLRIPMFWVLLKQQATRCPQCRRQILANAPVAFRYIVPLANGGSQQIENIKMLHAQCVTQERRVARKEAALRLAREGKRPVEIAMEIGVSLASVYLYLKL